MWLLGFLLLPMVLAVTRELKIDNYIVNIEGSTLTSVRATERSSDELNLSGLGLRRIDKNAFSDSINVKILNLANNSLTNLPESVFSKLTDLNHLSLVDNRINRFSNAFVGLGNLKSLNVSNNPLGFLGSGDFYGLPGSVEIFTSGSPIEKISVAVFEQNSRPLSERTMATRSKRSERETAFNTTIRFKICIEHGKLKLVDYLKEDEKITSDCIERTIESDLEYGEDLVLELGGLNITSVEAKWYRIDHKNINQIYLANNKISQVTSELLNDLPKNVIYFGLSDNKIERVESGIIENFYLDGLDLSNNMISEIENDAFERTNLRDLTLNDNRLSSTNFMNTLPPSMFTIRLENNRLVEISDGTLSRLEALYELRLQNNNIEEIREGSLRGFSYLEHLGLANNRIRKIAPGSFRNFQYIGHVDLHNNSIDNLEIGTFDGLDDVLSINLGKNKFTNLTKQLRASLPRNLGTLHLDSNEIESLEPGSFVNVPRRELHLEGNKISKIAKGSFQLPDLLSLDLGNNLLSQIDAEIFEDCRKLQTLSLNGNVITKIQKGFAKNLKSINQLDISMNPIKRLENGAFFGLPKYVPGKFIITSQTPIEVIQGGLFDDV